MERRTFIKSAALATAAMPLAAAVLPPATQVPVVKPPRLRAGDTLALVAPAGFISQKELDEAVNNLQGLGFYVEVMPHILQRSGYLAGSDEERAADINAAFADPGISGIVCARGGWGCARMFHLLDYQMIRQNPKVLIGYSDVTSLLYALYRQAGLVCFHGPVGTSTYNEFSVDHFKRVLMQPTATTVYYNAPADPTKPETQITPIRSGKARGKLAGGNLSLVASMAGTPYDLADEGYIIFLEEIREEPYRLDRMLTQMLQAGIFKKATGVAIGVFSRCEAKPDESGISNSFSMMEVLMDRLYPLGIPVLYGLSFGHILNKLTLPFGITAELDVDNQQLQLLEPAVL